MPKTPFVIFIIVSIMVGIVIYGGYCYGVVVLNLFIIVLCGFVYFCNVWGCVCVGFVLYGCMRLM